MDLSSLEGFSVNDSQHTMYLQTPCLGVLFHILYPQAYPRPAALPEQLISLLINSYDPEVNCKFVGEIYFP